MSKNKYIRLKKQYLHSKTKIYISRFNGEVDSWEVFPDIRSQCHKKISSKQEKSFFIQHENEYKEYGLKLRRRRSANNLFDSWDDLPSYVYKNRKSWKQSTKRKNQYYK
jgi:hypothetical protein